MPHRRNVFGDNVHPKTDTKIRETKINVEETFLLSDVSNTNNNNNTLIGKSSLEDLQEHRKKRRTRSKLPSSEILPNVDDKYAEAWLELGAPISYPFLRFLWAIFQWALDNFFLLKNTYNAITETKDSTTENNLWIAGMTVGFHIICCVLISIADTYKYYFLDKDVHYFYYQRSDDADGYTFVVNYSKEAISGQRKSRFQFWRFLAHVTLTMKFFRYLTAYLENRRKNQGLIVIHMRRNPITRREIAFVVKIKKNDYVECHYDLIEAFFKTVPAALLQVFFMFKTMPDARLKLTTTTDQDRFATVFYTILTTSVTATNYQFSYLMYKKVLHFQDCFRSNFRLTMNLNIPGDFSFVVTIVTFIATIGIRMCFYSFILFYSPMEFLVTIGGMLIFNWVFLFNWKRSSWRFRAVLENPLYGTPWLIFDFIEIWISLFIPGVHYPKPLDYLLNFYCTTIFGFIVFKSGVFLIPDVFAGRGNGTEYSILFQKENNSPISQAFIDNIVHSQFEQPLPANCTSEKMESDSKPPTPIDEAVFFISQLIQFLVQAHEYVTLHQMSYAEFFNTAISYMNIVNLFCLLYTILMNAFEFHDLDFPAQIANGFFVEIIGNDAEDWNDIDKIKKFLLFNILPNSVFFNQFNSRINCRKITWETFPEKDFNKLLTWLKTAKIPTSNKKFNKYCVPIVFLYNLFSPYVYPERIRTPNINWDVDDSLHEIKLYVNNQVLKEQLCCFADNVFSAIESFEFQSEKNNLEEIATVKLLLAVFFKNYDEIMKNTTSLRLALTFSFVQKTVSKGSSERGMHFIGVSETHNNSDKTYFSRITHAIMKKRQDSADDQM